MHISSDILSLNDPIELLGFFANKFKGAYFVCVCVCVCDCWLYEGW